MSKETKDKRSASQIKEELDNRINEIALETYKWAKENGCVRPSEDEPVQQYFIIQKGRKRTSKPIWTDRFPDEKPGMWPDVLMRMLQLGFPIAVDSMQGQYIGIDGEQGVRIGTQLNNIFTRAESARQMAQYIIESRMWNVAAPFIQKRVQEELKESDPLKLLQALDQLFLGAGIPVQMSIAQYLLAAGAE